METQGGEGVLATRPLRFSGTHLFVNVDTSQGELRVEVVDRSGVVIEPFSLPNCRAVRADSTREPVTWDAGDLATLAGREVLFRFHLRHGKLYAFWVSRESGLPSLRRNRNELFRRFSHYPCIGNDGTELRHGATHHPNATRLACRGHRPHGVRRRGRSECQDGSRPERLSEVDQADDQRLRYAHAGHRP